MRVDGPAGRLRNMASQDGDRNARRGRVAVRKSVSSINAHFTILAVVISTICATLGL